MVPLNMTYIDSSQELPGGMYKSVCQILHTYRLVNQGCQQMVRLYIRRTFSSQKTQQTGRYNQLYFKPEGQSMRYSFTQLQPLETTYVFHIYYDIHWSYTQNEG